MSWTMPRNVRGSSVLDLASGSGLVAIAAVKAGASRIIAADIDAFAVTASQMNADLNSVTLDIQLRRSCSRSHRLTVDVILVGDLFYEKSLAARCLAWLRQAEARGTSGSHR